jgi:hypothetical protein
MPVGENQLLKEEARFKQIEVFNDAKCSSS